MTVRLVSARANVLRLIALYGCAGLFGGPALLFLLIGPRAAWMWLLPSGLPVAARILALSTAVVAPAACVAVALRTRLLHPVELALPKPRWSWTAVAAAGTVLLLGLGATTAFGPGRNVGGALLAAHGVPLTVVFTCILLPAAQAAFYFGLLQPRLAEVLPAWEAVTLAAAAFALSGPLTGAPLPGFLLALLLGIWLGWCRSSTGVTGLAVALALGNAAALGLVLRVW